MSTITEKLELVRDCKSDIKNAIETKGVTVGDAPFDQYASKIGEISGVSEEVPENDVNFYDYDGRRIASYTIAEAKALTQAEYNAILPPAHSGLTFQEWNWSLADIQSYDRRFIDIGANYVTTDGKTHIKIKVTELDVFVYFRSKGGTLTIDWGDSTTPSTYTYGSSEGGHQFTHTYNQTGTYTLIVSSDTTTGNIVIVSGVVTSWSPSIIEVNAGNLFSFGYNSSMSQASAVVSCATDTVFEGVNNSFRGAIIPIIAIPKNPDLVISQAGAFYQMQGRVCFPAKITTMSSSGLVGSNTSRRIILPEATNGTVSNDAIAQCLFAEIISIPNSLGWTSQVNTYLANCISLQRLDIVQGWVPNFNFAINQSLRWTAETLIDFFNKLGTTQTAITLTFGSTNLNKLTAEEKAIATNKGYTLA